MKIYLASFKAKELTAPYWQIKNRLFSFHEIFGNVFGCKGVFRHYENLPGRERSDAERATL